MMCFYVRLLIDILKIMRSRVGYLTLRVWALHRLRRISTLSNLSLLILPIIWGLKNVAISFQGFLIV